METVLIVQVTEGLTINYVVLKEKSFGCFYMEGKGVLHFHIKDQRLYAHVFDRKAWQEVDIPSSQTMTLQKKIFKIIRNILKSEA